MSNYNLCLFDSQSLKYLLRDSLQRAFARPGIVGHRYENSYLQQRETNWTIEMGQSALALRQCMNDSGWVVQGRNEDEVVSELILTDE